MPGSVPIRLAGIAIGLLLLISAHAYGNTGECRITGLEIRPENNEVELSVDGYIEYGYFPLSEPDRLIFDFPGATLTLNDGNTLVEGVTGADFREVRLSQFSVEPVISRLVLLLDEPSTATVNFDPNEGYLVITVNKSESNVEVDNSSYFINTAPSDTTVNVAELEVTPGTDPGSQFVFNSDDTQAAIRFPNLPVDNIRAEQLRFPDRLHVRIFTGQILDSEQPRFNPMGRGNIWNQCAKQWVSYLDRDGRGIVDITVYLYPNVGFSQVVGADGIPEINIFPLPATVAGTVEEPTVEIEPIHGTNLLGGILEIGDENTAPEIVPETTDTASEEFQAVEVDGFSGEGTNVPVESTDLPNLENNGSVTVIPATETMEIIENGVLGMDVAQEPSTAVASAGNPVLSGSPDLNVPVAQNNLLGNGYSSDSNDQLDMKVGEVVVLKVNDLVRASMGNPAVATINVISQEEILITALAPGNTTLVIWESDDICTTRAISVLDATLAREEEIADVIGDSNITVNILMSGESTSTPGIVLEGSVATEEEKARAGAIAALYAGDRVTNMIEVSNPRQVLVKVRVVEVDSRALDEHLSQFSAAARTNDDMFTIGVLTDLLDPENPGGGLLDTSTRPGIVNSDTTNDLSFDPVDMVLNELVTNREAKILSEPNVVGLSGHIAHFRVGGEIPYTYQNEQGINVVEFKEFGISLDMTPNVDSQGNIMLLLTPVVRTVDMALAIGGIPGFRTREMTTTVQLREGDTLVIGGLIQNEISEVVAEIPLLSDIPILGELFRSKRFTEDQTELVIFLTPYILDNPSQSESIVGINPGQGETAESE
ncbi:MAG: pilus assembly protein N-terminal domain-containing protein [bacterium]|nr:pilus assembly protein N-terminal domain-containing protein [bacterium]